MPFGAPVQEARLGRHVVPVGVDVMVDIHAMHRSERLWHEPGRFNPERWAVPADGGAAGQGPYAAHDGLYTVEPEGGAGPTRPTPTLPSAPQVPTSATLPMANCSTAGHDTSEAIAAPLCSPAAFMPFSAGPRSCFGQRLAVVEVKTVVALLCAHFKFNLLAGAEVRGMQEGCMYRME